MNIGKTLLPAAVAVLLAGPAAAQSVTPRLSVACMTRKGAWRKRPGKLQN